MIPRRSIDSLPGPDLDPTLFSSRARKSRLTGDPLALREHCVSDSLSSWPAPPDEVTLGEREIHVWRASVEAEASVVSRMLQLLSADEQARAERFRVEIVRRRFIVTRGCLRMILSCYAGVAPAEIRFDYATHGKPVLGNSIAPARKVNFNLAHSNGLGLFAFTRVGDIGVDLEQVRPEFSETGIARRFFSAAEVASLNEIPAPARSEAFFHCWTRKEAFVKAKGKGLSLPLDHFDVTLKPEERAALLRTGWDEDEARRWSLKTIDVGQGYVGAMAVEAHNWRLSCWQVDDLDSLFSLTRSSLKALQLKSMTSQDNQA
jgi:4'-phosphopantetheinyl transferase